ncbi:hypothetical protein SADUNF_Sadunf10G0159300 [Salix dunnii]|uniref:Uncharacterized protein n=1 Tax=Salix dunnii TaxID=1413687 RepID=A0A835MSB7_9ROSI|nr:hypothetical protein SADUNF_Sadunf10G0159300 [Salix dunnii]
MIILFWFLILFGLYCSCTIMMISVNSRISYRIYIFPTMDTLHSAFWKDLGSIHCLLRWE